MGARRGRLSSPWLRFHGMGRADVYIIIRVRASGCGESALNPPTSPPIPRRRSAPVPAQRRALPEHFRPPPQPRRTPAGLTTHSPSQHRRPPPHSDAPFPSTSAPPRSADTRPQAARCIPRRPHNPSPPKTSAHPTQRHALPEHFLTSTQRDAFPADLTTHPPPKTFARPRTAPSSVPAAPPCLPLRSASGTKKRHRTVDVRCRMSRSTVVAVGHWGW